jgi:hypothetical protein
MEFDADRHEATIVGTAVFEETTARLPQLRVAAGLTWRNVDELRAMGRAPEDLPGTIAAVEQILTDATVARVREEALARRTGRWDTHPSDAERIVAARAFNAPSLFTLPGEARLLFADLSALGREATLYHYEKLAKLNCGEVRLVTVEESIAALQSKSMGASAVHRLFHCSPECVAAWVTFPVGNPVAGRDAERQCESDRSQQEPAFWATAEKARLHFCARTIRDAGVKVNVAGFQLLDDGVEAVRSEQVASESELVLKMVTLNRMAKPAIAALERAAGLVWDKDPTCFVFESGAFFTGEVRDLWRLAGAFSESLDDIRRMRWIISALGLVRLNLRLFPLARGANLLEDLEAKAEGLMEKVKSCIGAVVLEGGEVSPATALVQGLVAREREYDKSGLESFVQNAEAVRALVLYRLAHFATVYESERVRPEPLPALATELRPSSGSAC